MLVEIGSFTLEKAKNAKENDKVVPIRMVANRLEVDKDGQEILPQAFNKATVGKFLEHGVIDWHHQSVTAKTPQERAAAILGRPYDFQWEAPLNKADGRKLPTVYANLTKSHPIVRDSILPHLEADNQVFAASVGGSVRKARQVQDPATQRNKEQILEIEWEHLAIAGAPYVISAGSEIAMVKAYGSESREVLIRYSDMTAFEEQHDLLFRGNEIYKALQAGAGTDVAQHTGLDALRVQSLEGSPAKLTYSQMTEKIIKGLMDSSIGSSEKGVKVFLRANGMSEDEANEFMVRFRGTIKRALNLKN